MATEKINVLDPQGVKILSTALIGKTQLRIDSHIIQEIEKASDKNVVSGVLAKSLFDALNNKDVEIQEAITKIIDDVDGIALADIDAVKTRVETLEETVNNQSENLSTIEGKASTNENDISAANDKLPIAETNINGNASAITIVQGLINQLSETISGLEHFNLEFVIGSIDTVDNPSENILYFQKDSEEDPTWVLYIYIEALAEHWICIGDMSFDLQSYWSKDDIEEIKDAIGLENLEPLTKDEINVLVDAAFAKLNDPALRLFTFDESTGTITGLTDEGKSATNIIIPPTINGVAVTSIGIGAFYGCTSLSDVNIPEGVTSIRQNAFEGCTSLQSVTIPSSVTSIAAYAFNGCTRLAAVTIPEGVSSIGGSAFEGCTSLQSVTIPSSVTSIGDYAFNGCTSLTDVYYNGTEDGWNAITIGTSNEALINATKHFSTSPNSFFIVNNETGTITGLTDEGKAATELNIPSTINDVAVTSIGEYAFCDCPALTSVTIPDSVTSIGGYAFYGDDVSIGCPALTSVTIPDSVTSIGGYAFYSCASLTDVYYDGTEDQWNAINIETSGNASLINATKHYK